MIHINKDNSSNESSLQKLEEFTEELYKLEEKRLEDLEKIRLACFDKISEAEVEYSNAKYKARSECEKALAKKEAEYKKKQFNLQTKYNIAPNILVNELIPKREVANHFEEQKTTITKHSAMSMPELERRMTEKTLANVTARKHTYNASGETKNTKEAISQDKIKTFLSKRNDYSIMNTLKYLKINGDEVVDRLSKITISEWQGGKRIQNITLIDGTVRDTYVVSEDCGKGNYLIAPALNAIISDGSIVSDAFIYFFDFDRNTSGSTSIRTGRDCEIIEPAIVGFDGSSYYLKKKGSIKVN